MALRLSQRTVELRMTSSTSAPPSCSSAADSMALCPQPTTITGRHLVLPKIHGLSESPCFQASRSQMRGHGQSIWTCADDGHLATRYFHRILSFLFLAGFRINRDQGTLGPPRYMHALLDGCSNA